VSRRGTANAAESSSRHERRRNFYNLQVCNYRSSYFNDALNTPFEEQPSYGLVDASLKWNDPSAKYSASLGVKNAFNKAYDLAAYFTPGSGPISVIPDRGREWYLSVKADY
jgi:outer membrane receptor protein involved in Fe transport